jgi:hypothetical protein
LPSKGAGWWLSFVNTRPAIWSISGFMRVTLHQGVLLFLDPDLQKRSWLRHVSHQPPPEATADAPTADG